MKEFMRTKSIANNVNHSTSYRSTGTAVARRSFLRNLSLSACLLPTSLALADEDDQGNNNRAAITDSDADILRFLAAAEILETDFWQQYTEFANLDGPYREALEVIDDDMPTYVTQNTNDEFSHQNFLNAFLVKMHKQPVNLE